MLFTAATGLALWWWVGRQGIQGKELISMRLDAVKVASATAIGGGGLFALYLTARRQRTQELELDQRRDEFRHTEKDAVERRITELYSKSVEQLGSDKASIRLGAMYALERLADGNPDHRQTVISMLCAYLRMPFMQPSVSFPVESAELAAGAIDKVLRQEYQEVIQEREVRMTAQRIIADHLRMERYRLERRHSVSRYWDGEFYLDLTGATLIDLDLSGCRLSGAIFVNVVFSGSVEFVGALFSECNFQGALFEGVAWFEAAEFDGDSGFTQARFKGESNFGDATFRGVASFNETRFDGEADFGSVIFEAASFRGTVFNGPAYFGNVVILGATFEDVTFAHHPTFVKAFVGRNSLKAPMQALGWVVDETASVSIEGHEGLWAPLVPVPSVLSSTPIRR